MAVISLMTISFLMCRFWIGFLPTALTSRKTCSSSAKDQCIMATKPYVVVREIGHSSREEENAQPNISDGTSERDSLEHQSIGSLIREGFPPISQVTPYPINIEETTIQFQAPPNTPLVGLPYPDFTNFRDFDQRNRTIRMFPLGQMATKNSLESVPLVVTLVATMLGSGATALQSAPSAAQ